MQVKKLILLCLGVWAFGLNIYESVELVLQNSHKVREQEHSLSKLKSELGIYYGAYYPKVDLSYQSIYAPIDRFGNRASLELSTNLFNGLKDQNNIKRQEQNILVQEEYVKKAQEEMKYMTKKLYVQILLAKGLLQTSQESLQLLENQLKQAQQFYKQGISAKNNVLSVEVSLASVKLDINSYTTRLNYLVSTLEQLIEQKINLEELEDLPINEEEVDYDRLSLIVFEYRPEYKALQKQKEALLYEIEGAKGGYYPKIDLGVFGDISFGGEYYGKSQARVALGLSLNLFNGLKDYSLIEAKRYELLSLESKIAEFRRNVLVELKKAVGDFHLSRDQYVLSKKTIESAQENYRIVSNRYKQNLETSSSVLDAELMLKNARASLLKAQYEIWEYLFYVEFLVGGNRSFVF